MSRQRTALSRRPNAAGPTLPRTAARGALLAGGLAAALIATIHAAHPPPNPVAPLPLLAAQQGSTSTTSAPAPPAGDPTATMTSPADGTTVTNGAAVTLTAALSPDLVTALKAGSGAGCTFHVGDDANSVAAGTLDLTASTCTGAWTFTGAGSYGVAAWVKTPAGITYVSAPITLSVSSGVNPRCTGTTGAPATCAYRWTEVYYTAPSDTRYARVCDLDSGCQWTTAHTAWPQVSGAAYWINSTGSPLPDGNLAEAYLCVGSSPADWTAYTSAHDFGALLVRPETSAAPVPVGNC